MNAPLVEVKALKKYFGGAYDSLTLDRLKKN